MPKHLQNILVVSASTFGSRVLGLLRDKLSYAFFGVQAINSAFVFAWGLPNLFRRLLGEGALTSSFIPILSEALERGGRPEAFKFLNQVLSRLFVVLVGVVIVSMAALAGAEKISGLEDQWRLGFEFGVILMPYVLLVCLAAALLAALNVLGHYTVSALSQVWLNLSMIFSLGLFGWYFGRTEMEQMYWQCAGVLVGGLLQVGLPARQLYGEGWRPHWDWSWSPRLGQMLGLLAPGVFGASITQINVLVSGCFALSLNESARTVLYASSRLMELPLGMFTIAFATVLFPKIALLAAQGDREGMAQSYAQGLRLIFAITVPAALGLVILREPVVRVLFEGGKFDAAAVRETTPVIALGALGIPFFSLATLATRGFHSMKDTRTPVRVAVWTFIVNLALTIALMRPLGTPGLALANLVSSIFQSLALQRLLLHKDTPLARPEVGRALGVIAMGGVGMGLVTAAGWWGLTVALGDVTKLASYLAVALLIPVAVLIYFLLLRLGKFEDWPELQEMVGEVFRRGERS